MLYEVITRRLKNAFSAISSSLPVILKSKKSITILIQKPRPRGKKSFMCRSMLSSIMNATLKKTLHVKNATEMSRGQTGSNTMNSKWGFVWAVTEKKKPTWTAGFPVTINKGVIILPENATQPDTATYLTASVITSYSIHYTKLYDPWTLNPFNF